jgi:hypothetical protein
MNLMMAPVSFQRLASGTIPAYLIPKLEMADLQEQGAIQMATTSGSVRETVKGFESGDALHYEGG